MSEIAFNVWIKEKLPFFKLMSAQVSFVLENLLKQSNINYLSVESRTKTLENINEKIKRKAYSNPRESLTDISGVRIILFLEEDVEKVCSIIKHTFSIDDENSISDLTRLASDKIGYRSTHYVCDIGENRIQIPEYKSFAGLKFEVQVRTILQHAWANLTHDRVYKLGTQLPEQIKRKVNLYSGMLEIVDLGFSEIVKDVERYRVNITQDDASEIEMQNINSLNLIEFMARYCREQNYKYIELIHGLDSDMDEVILDMDEVINELKLYNVKTLKDVKELIPDNYIDNLNEMDFQTSIVGMLRDFMLIRDYRKLIGPPLPWSLAISSLDAQQTYILFSKYIENDELNDLFDVFGLGDYK